MTATASSTTKSAADFALLFEEIVDKLQSGEGVDVEVYVRQYPDHAERLRRLLPAAGMLAELGRSAARQESAGIPVAGALDPEFGVLGDFRILREIGRGGMGVVYEAVQISLKRRVALKVLPFACVLDPRQLQRFQNEAQAAACLHHTGIVPVYAVGNDRGVHFYAMQYIEGQPLDEIIHDLRKLHGRHQDRSKSLVKPDANPTTTPSQPPAADACPSARTISTVQAGLSTERSITSRDYFEKLAHLGIQAAEALDHAHQQGIIHRDVKPANLILDARANLWITDFGLAHCQSQAGPTMTGELVGTLRYMSPEQALGKRMVIDPRTDVYSLGATLYELLTLRPVFAGTNRQELLRQIAFEEPLPPRRLDKAIPADLETIVLKALGKEPAERYATAEELAGDLQRFLKDESIKARRPTLVARARKWARRHQGLVRATTVLVFLVLLTSAAFLWREQRQRATLEGAVEAALERVDSLQQQERWEDALAVLAVAEGQLEGRGLGTLPERVKRWKRNVEMLTRLEKAHLQTMVVTQKTGFDHAGADRLYAEAFKWYGLDVTALDSQEAAEGVRASAIRSQLTAALAGWAFVRDELINAGGASLRAVVELADDDPWRRRLREAAQRRDRTALEKLAEEEAALSQPPVNLRLLASVLHDTGSLAAERLLRRAQQTFPADFSINFWLANVLSWKNQQDIAETVRFYQAALALRPRSPVVYLNLGNALSSQTKLTEAEDAFRRAIALQPDFASAHFNLGNTLQQQKKPREAEVAFRQAVALKPDHYVAWNNLGASLKHQHHLAEAIEAFRKAVDVNPDYTGGHIHLADALMENGEWSEAKAAYGKALALEPNHAPAHNSLALLLATCVDPQVRDPGWAVRLAKRAVQLDPKNAAFWNTLGVASFQTREWREAEKAYRQAVALKPNQHVAWQNLGASLKMQHRLPEAIECYRKAVDVKPDYTTGHINLADTLVKNGEWSEAKVAYGKALALGPTNASAHNSLAWLLATCVDLKLRNPDEAVRLAKRAVQLDPKNAAFWNSLGVAYYRAREWQAGVAALEKSMQLGKGGDAIDWFFLAMADWQLGNTEEALQWYQKAVVWMDNNRPQDPELTRFRIEAAALLGL